MVSGDQESRAKTPWLEVLNAHECLEYLHSRDLGRVAVQTNNEVDIFPVNYACNGQVVVFRTASTTVLHRLRQARFTFEVDSWDPSVGLGWSVVLKGVAREVTGGMDLFSAALRKSHVLPRAPGKREHWIAVFPSQITGRRFSAPSSAH